MPFVLQLNSESFFFVFGFPKFALSMPNYDSSELGRVTHPTKESLPFLDLWPNVCQWVKPSLSLVALLLHSGFCSVMLTVQMGNDPTSGVILGCPSSVFFFILFLSVFSLGSLCWPLL